MALLQKLKELLGIGGDDGRPERRDTEVTVERDPDVELEPDLEGEPEPEPVGEPEIEPEEETGTAEESAEQATIGEEEDEAGTGDVEAHVDDGEETEELETEAEEEAGEEAGEEVGEEVGEEAEEEAGEEAGEEIDEEVGEGADEEGESVVNVKGIGPTYAERLEAVDITTVAELATADVEVVAEGAKVGEGRAKNWIERARER